MSVTFRLSEFLLSNKISQKELSELLNKKAGTISGIMNGKSKVTTDQLVILSTHYENLDLRWLLTGKPSTSKEKVDLLRKAKADEIKNEVNEPCPCCEKLKIKVEGLEALLESKNETIAALKGEPKKETKAANSAQAS
jgi:transcriptional regulator with XRE-family HTH domain